MAGFAVYSTTSNPQRLYADGTIDHTGTVGVREMVRFGDRPLDLVVDVAHDRILWFFKAARRTTATRTGYFIGEYQADSDELFGAFARRLERLHADGEWTFPDSDDPRWQAGFDIGQVPVALPGLPPPAQSQFYEQLRQHVGQSTTPIEIGMRSYRNALQVVRGIHAADVACTVAVASHGEATTLDGVDVLLRPDATADFEPRSDTAATLLDQPAASADRLFPAVAGSDGRRTPGLTGMLKGARTAGRAGVAILGVLALVFVAAVRPALRMLVLVVLTVGVGGTAVRLLGRGDAGGIPYRRAMLAGVIGVAAVGLYLGGVATLLVGGANASLLPVGSLLGGGGVLLVVAVDRLARTRPRIAVLFGVGLLGALLASGGYAAAHGLGYVTDGAAATRIAGVHLGFVAGLGLYVAWKCGTTGPETVFPYLRTRL